MKNINLGLLGHVDCGKTSLAKTISTIGSTAAFDKHPQSQERGITIDLGFSTLQLNSYLQITLVDCPGHSSLIRTVIGGIQIINGIILVLDATQGFQHQTNECLLLAKIFCKPVLVVLNKWDLVKQEGGRGDQMIERISILKQRIGKYLRNDEIEFVCVSTKTGEGVELLREKLFEFGNYLLGKEIDLENLSMLSLNEKEFIKDDSVGKIEPTNQIESANRNDESRQFTPKTSQLNTKSSQLTTKSSQLTTKSSQLTTSSVQSNQAVFMVDHVFSLKGQGTVLTGTLLVGLLNVGDLVEILGNVEMKRIKSIHVFKRPQNSILAGDRAGLCIGAVDLSLFPSERMLVGSLGAISRQIGWIYCSFNHIKQFKYSINSKSKFHIIIGHETVLGNVHLLTKSTDNEHLLAEKPEQDNLFALICLDTPISLCNPSIFTSCYVASKLDIDLSTNSTSLNSLANECRFAFHGKVLIAGNDDSYSQFVKNLSIVQQKEKIGRIERIIPDSQFVLVKDLIIPQQFQCPTGLEVKFENGTLGKIDSYFGQNKKLKIQVASTVGLKRESLVVLSYKKQILNLA